jgi:putative chitinase
MADISKILGGSIKDKILGVAKTQGVIKENPNALMKVIGKNFMSLPGLARDLNVARQNFQTLVKLEGGKPARGADAQFLKEGERAKKLEVETAEDKKPTLISKAGEKLKEKAKKKYDKLKDQYSKSKIAQKMTKYLGLAAIVGVVFVAFKDTFVEWATGLFDAIKTKFDEFTNNIKQWFQDSIQPIIDKAKELIAPIVDTIKGFVEKISDWFGEKIQMLAEKFPQTFTFIKRITDKVSGMIDGLRSVGEKIGLFKKKEKVGPVDDTAERQKLQRQQSEALERQETERVKQLEKEKQYTGDDEIVRARLGLPPKTETMRREEEAKKQAKPIEVAPAPDSIIVPSPVMAKPKEEAKPRAPSAAPAPTSSAPPGAQKPTAEPAEVPSGTPGLVVSALNDAGITSPKAHANVLATVKAESNFKVKSENLNYTSADRIKSIFGARRIPSVDFAQQFVRNPEALANHVYKTTDGNSAPGDGFKYRGRGFIQHTGKNQYAAISKATGTDLLSNPDALNSPEVAAKAIPWFFLGYKRMKPEDLDNMSKVNKAVGFAGGAEYAAKREASAQQIYAQMQSGSGTQMASASSDVASGQRQQMKPQTPVVVNAPTTNTKVVKTTQMNPRERQDTGSSLASMRV